MDWVTIKARSPAWFIFLMDLIFGPFVALFSKQYNLYWYRYELKSILVGKYYYYKNPNKEG